MSLARLKNLNPARADRPLSRVSRYTARFHLPAAALEGLVAGVFTLNDVVLRKTFGAGALLITLMVMAQPVSQLLAIVWGNVMQGRSKRPFILGFGGAGRLLLLLVGVAGTASGFAVPVVLSIGLSVAIIPALNALYQSNYPDDERGRVYGWVLSATAVTTIVSSLAAGLWMDHDPGLYRVIYPVAGLIGLISVFLYYRIRPRGDGGGGGGRRGGRKGAAGRDASELGATEWFEAVAGALRNPLRGARTLFTTDPDFLRFEIGYMLYGMAFMMLQPVIPIFLVDEIQVQYSEAATARGLIYWGMIALLSPWCGRLLDRWNAVRLSVFGFALLALFPLAMAFSRSIHHVYGAFALFGLAMTPVNIAWMLGPILFAGRRDAAAYMGVHVTMVGVRGLIGNPLGLLMLQTIGSRPTFLASGLLFGVATLVMWRLQRRMARAATAPLPA